jgi:hypothetical protein
VDGFGDRQAEYRNDRRVADLAEELCSEGRERSREGLAIAQDRQVSGNMQSRCALGDARDQ